MASLNTLRTRGGVIVSIVIGLALLMFILSDIFSSGSGMINSRKMRVGEINGTSIDYNEFLTENDRLQVIAQAMSGKTSLTADEHDRVREMAWESLIRKYSYNPGFEKFGILPLNAEREDMVSGEYLSEVITTNFINRQTGMFDPVVMKEFVDYSDIDETGQTAVLWNYLKEEMVNSRVFSKYEHLINKGIFINMLEIESGLNGANNSYDALVVTLPYSGIADSTITVSNSEIKEYYNKNKESFRQTASRDIEYVVFDLLPSDEDYQEARKYIEEIAEEFRETDSPMQYASLNSYISPNTAYLKDTEIDPAIVAAVFDNPAGFYGPVLAGDVYTMARLSDKKTIPDSLGAKHILLPAGQDALADSLISVIRRSGNFGEIAFEYSEDPSVSVNEGDLGFFPPEYMIPEFSEACMQARVGDIFKVETQVGLHIVELTYKSRPVEKAQIATIRYRVEPSGATEMAVYSDATNFYAQASGSYDNFKKATNEQLISKRVARIRNTDRVVSGLNDSRELVKWAFNAKKGSVSNIMQLGGDYVVAVLTDAREEGIASLDQASASIRPILVNNKKAEILSAKLQGSSIDQIASANGVEAIEVDGVEFTPFYIDGVGFEPALVGAISSGFPKSGVSKPVKGGMGVFVYQITDHKVTDAADGRSEKVRQEAMATSYIGERAMQALVEESDIKDSRVKFF